MYDTINILIISYFISICVLTGYCHDLEENSDCLPMSYHGTCKKIKNCAVALLVLKNPGIYDLDVCGFNSTQKLVCCPDPSVRQPILETSTQEYYVFSGNYSSVEIPDPSKKKNCTIEDSPCQLLCHHGICTQIKDCPPAIIAHKNTGKHGLDRCGFEGMKEIVCCPKLPEIDGRGPPINRKCEKMCQKVYTDNNIDPTVMSPYILNGKNATEGQFPHAVALGFENEFQEIEWNCGASLISPRFLLTAAHCLICQRCGELKKARMGIVDIGASYQDIDVKSNISHPDYNITSRHNDIGIVELVQNVFITQRVFPACLYTRLNDPQRLEIFGWGQTDPNDRSSKSRFLQYAKVELVPLDKCHRTMATKLPYSLKVIVETQICATGRPSDACVGDSGGPLQTEMEDVDGYHIVGVISYGVVCGGTAPGIYTKVATYLDWIEGIVWPD